MNQKDAKLILASIHEGTTPDSDSEQAFALLDSDPALREWFEEEQAFDKAVSSKLAEIEPPADLKASLVELLDNKKIVNAERSFRPQLFAAAAAVILVSLVVFQTLSTTASAKSFDNFRGDMVEFAQSDFELDHKDPDITKIYAWLHDKDAICPAGLPESIGAKEAFGCKVLDWDKNDVTLICLVNDSDQIFHCFIIPRSEFDTLPEEKTLRNTLKLDGVETCSWTDKEHLFLLVGSDKDVNVSAPEL